MQLVTDNELMLIAFFYDHGNFATSNTVERKDSRDILRRLMRSERKKRFSLTI